MITPGPATLFRKIAGYTAPWRSSRCACKKYSLARILKKLPASVFCHPPSYKPLNYSCMLHQETIPAPGCL